MALSIKSNQIIIIITYYIKIINTKYDEREAEPTWKEIFTENNRTEWVRVVKISYLADKTKAGKDVLKILKKSEGKYEEK